jgi:tetratricopeptide (TPR) repeat protein
MTTDWPPRAPGARGRLATNSVGELLVFALDQRFEGSLVFETPDGEKSALVSRAGCVVKARTAVAVEPLGRLLLGAGEITSTQLESALLRAGQTGCRLGQALVDVGALSAEQLASALAEQLARRVSWLAQLPGQSAYGLYPDRDFLADLPDSDADPLALIWRAVRDAAESARQASLIISLSGRKLRLHAAAAPERLGLIVQEQMVVNALRTRPRALEELLRTGLLESSRLQRLVLALALTHQLDYGQRELPLDAGANVTRASRPPFGSQPSLAPGPRSSPPVAASSRPRSAGVSLPPGLVARASSPPRASGVPRAPSSASTRPPSSAERASVAPLLPPRSSLAPSQLPPRQHSQPALARSSARPGAPSGAPPERRTESVGSLHPTDPVVLARARANFEAALTHVQRQQFDAAEKLARKATEEDTGSAEYLALHAWLRSQLGELVNSEHAAQIVAALDRAVLKDKDSVSIRFYRGQVNMRLGREDEALRDFRFVLRRDPNHVEAARELRLHQMRKRGEEKKRPSLLAKLFLR